MACQIVYAKPLKGNRELLKLVANGYKANYDKLETMQGSAQIKSLYSQQIGGYEKEREASAEFLLDKTQRARRWTWRGRDDKGEIIQAVSGMIKDKDIFMLPHNDNKPDKRPYQILEIRPIESYDREIGIVDSTFDPLYWYKAIREDIYKLCMGYYKAFDSPNLIGGTIIREDNYIILEVGDETVTNRYTFDADKGYCLVKYYAKDPQVEDSWDFNFKEIDGVFVPCELKRVKDNIYPEETVTFRIEAKISEIIVNEPIDPKCFEIESLGLRAGDYIDDYRAKVSYQYGLGDQMIEETMNEFADSVNLGGSGAISVPSQKEPNNICETVASAQVINEKYPVNTNAARTLSENEKTNSNIHIIILVAVAVIVFILFFVYRRYKN